MTQTCEMDHTIFVNTQQKELLKILGIVFVINKDPHALVPVEAGDELDVPHVQSEQERHVRVGFRQSRFLPRPRRLPPQRLLRYMRFGVHTL